MKRLPQHFFEHLLLASVVLISVLGFWESYFGEAAAPNWYHHLHVATNFSWLGLMWYQLSLIGTKRFGDHRKLGLTVLGLAPLLFATTALLSVHSAHKGVVSGEGDFLIIQNVMGTLELGFLIFMAFALRKNRKLHASFLLSTTVLFMGIALFFALISFASQFKIEGPETFHRFGEAAMTGQLVCLAVGAFFVAKDFRHGWPLLLAAFFFLLNELIRALLARNGLIGPLTAFVGAMSKPLTAIGAFALLLALLIATGLTKARQQVLTE